MKKRFLPLILALCVGLTSFAGCGSTSGSAPQSGSAATITGNAAEYLPEETLTIAAKATPQGIDTSFHNSIESMQAFRNCMDTLLVFGTMKDENG